MKTIKIIDLLNKIANGEEVPKKIKYNNTIFVYENCTYNNEKYDYIDLRHYLCINWNYYTLTEEVEILEEEKKLPGKIYWNVSDNIYTTYINGKKCKTCRDSFEELSDMYRQKINELLDYLESKEKGE